MHKLKWGFVAILTAVLLLLPLLPFSSNKILTLMIQMFLVASLAASWNILAGYAGQINLGHAAFFGLGALTTRLLWLNAYPFILSFLAGGAVATLFALIICIIEHLQLSAVSRIKSSIKSNNCSLSL